MSTGHRKPTSRSTAESSRKSAGKGTGGQSRDGAPALSASAGKPDRQTLFFSAGLVLLTVLVYGSVTSYEFVSFDDPQYMTENARVQAGVTWSGVRWAFTTGQTGNWHPLTWLSHMLDVQLFGMNAGPHHVVNVAFHVVNSLLLFFLLRRLTGAVGRSAFVAALFAVHPSHVESVAWISERKDVLSTLFWMLTLWSYTTWVREHKATAYALALAFLALGLMAKPMLVTVPCVLLLLDYWPLQRTLSRRLLLEKIPFFGLVVVSSLLTFHAQSRDGAVSALSALPLGTRLSNAAVAYASYMAKLVWPANLAAIYPYSRSGYGWRLSFAIVVLVAVSALAVWAARRRRYVIVGWLWFLGTLVPVIGLVQVGVQSMADRYTYVPFIGLFIIVAWGIADVTRALPVMRFALPAAAAAVVAANGIAARRQADYWRDSYALWDHTVRVTSDNPHAETALGSILTERGKNAEAAALFIDALRLEPDFAEAHNKLGVVLANQGRTAEAVSHYEAALRSKPALVEARYNLGNAQAAQGNRQGAIASYLEALRVRPDDPATHNALGSILDDEGKTDEAIAQYLEALRLNPRFADAHNNLGAARAKQGRADDAIREFLAAIEINPNQADAHYNVAVMLDARGRRAEAIQHLRDALRLNPNHQGAKQAMQIIAGRSGP